MRQTRTTTRLLTLLLALILVLGAFSPATFAEEVVPFSGPTSNRAVVDSVIDNFSTATPLQWHQLVMLTTVGVDLDDFTLPTIPAMPASLTMLNASTWAERAISMIAMGQNPRNHGGRDIIDELVTLVNLNPSDPLNAAGWGAFVNVRIFYALAAADALDEIDTAVIDTLLAMQGTSGYFDMWGFGTAWGYPVEDTALLITILQPFFALDARVADAIALARTFLKSQQLPCGAFEVMGMGIPGWETTSHVIQAIAAMGECPLDWMVGGDMTKTPIHAMMEFIHSDGTIIGGVQAWQGWLGLASVGLETNIFTNLQAPITWPTVTIPLENVDLTDLLAAIAAAEGRTQDDYTAASWTAMQTALTAARAVRDHPTTQAAANTATNSLQTAINALWPIAVPPPPPTTATISVRDPGRAAPFFTGTLDLITGDTAYSLLRRTGLSVGSRTTAMGTYVYSIAGVAEFSGGPGSGWMFTVTGTFPGTDAASALLSAGDSVAWLFTRDLGHDIGGGFGPPPPPVPPQWDNPFSDVAYDSWYFDYVRFVYEHGLKVGTAPGQFSPHTNLTRGMIVTILWRLADEPSATGGNGFDDVASGRWYSAAIAWANANEIAQGFGDGRFGPSDYVTREQLAVIFRNFAAYQGLEITTGPFVADFHDAETTSGWALEAMQWANANGLISGRTQTTLAPAGNATRAESAAFLYRFIENIAGGMMDA